MIKCQFGKSPAAINLANILERQPKAVSRGVTNFLNRTHTFFNEIKKIENPSVRKSIGLLVYKQLVVELAYIKRINPVVSYVHNILYSIYRESIK